MKNLIKIIFNQATHVLLEICKKIDSFLKNSDKFPDRMQTIGLALLAILIPLAIAILNDVLQKKRGNDKDFAELDLHVILDEVFGIRKVLLCISLIFLPLFFWQHPSISFFKILLFIIWLAGIFLLCRTILNIYKWVKGNTFDFRFSYLRKLRKCDDAEITWRSTWQTKDINIQNERDFFKIFSSKIDEMLKNE